MIKGVKYPELMGASKRFILQDLISHDPKISDEFDKMVLEPKLAGLSFNELMPHLIQLFWKPKYQQLANNVILDLIDFTSKSIKEITDVIVDGSKETQKELDEMKKKIKSKSHK